MNLHESLNPYYTGSYSMSLSCLFRMSIVYCLNPYYTGSYSMRVIYNNNGIAVLVLILIILEVTL